jgi:hypothetical protein
MSKLTNPIPMRRNSAREQLLEKALLRLMIKHGYTFFTVPFQPMQSYQDEGYVVRFDNFSDGKVDNSDGHFDVSIQHRNAV